MPIVDSHQRRRRVARHVSFRAAPLEPADAEWLALDAQLEVDHLARRIHRALARLDLTPLWAAYAGFGSPAYPPHRLLAAVLLETQRGHPQPAQWHRHAKESIPLRWLLHGLVPSRSCWHQFRDRIGPALLGLAQQAVRQAIHEGFTPAHRAAIDGTLLAANASRHHVLDELVLTRRARNWRRPLLRIGRACPSRGNRAGWRRPCGDGGGKPSATTRRVTPWLVGNSATVRNAPANEPRPSGS